eukprot:2370258-Pyramimonas_sp.AAC.1
MQELHGLRACGFQNVALAIAPRTSRPSAAHSFKMVQEFHGFPRSTYQTRSLGRTQDYAGATLMLFRGVEVRKTAF